MIMKNYLILSASFFSGVAFGGSKDIVKEDWKTPVTYLTSDTFDEFIQDNDSVLVQFYAPWCGHCKQFKSEYYQAAVMIEEKGIGVHFAVVDATSEVKLAEFYDVRGYPTIKYFSFGKDIEYSGGREPSNIVAWVEKKKLAPLTPVDTAEAVLEFAEKGSTVVFATPVSDAEFSKKLVNLAIIMEDVFFAMVSDSGLLQEAFGKKMPDQGGLYVKKAHDEKFAIMPYYNPTLVTEDAVKKFISVQMLPYLSEFHGENSVYIFEDPRPKLFYFRDDRNKTESDSLPFGDDVFQSLAGELNQGVLLATVGAYEAMEMRLMDYVGVFFEDLPTVRMVIDPTANMAKYRLEEWVYSTSNSQEQVIPVEELTWEQKTAAITADNIRNFVDAVVQGKAKPHIRSELLGQDDHNTPHDRLPFRLTGSNFMSTIANHKFVLVKFYAPWCGHCKKLEPLYKDLANRYNVVGSDVLVAKFDATQNDLPIEATDCDVPGYPNFRIFNQKPTGSVSYSGDRDINNFISFIEKAREGETRAEL